MATSSWWRSLYLPTIAAILAVGLTAGLGDWPSLSSDYAITTTLGYPYLCLLPVSIHAFITGRWAKRGPAVDVALHGVTVAFGVVVAEYMCDNRWPFG